jgi:hypothetical protein
MARGRGTRWSGRDEVCRWDRVGLEDVEAFKFLIEDSKRLESLRLFHLLFEPVFDLILLDFLQVLVVVIEVPVELQEGDHVLIADRTDQAGAGGGGADGTVVGFEGDSGGNVVSFGGRGV